MATQQQMLDAQWSDSTDNNLFGFTDSDWYKSAKDVLSFGWMLNNADKLQATNQQQAQLMYAVPTNTQPNAQYIDPRLAVNSQQSTGIDNKYLLLGGVAVLAYLVFK